MAMGAGENRNDFRQFSGRDWAQLALGLQLAGNPKEGRLAVVQVDIAGAELNSGSNQLAKRRQMFKLNRGHVLNHKNNGPFGSGRTCFRKRHAESQRKGLHGIEVDRA